MAQITYYAPAGVTSVNLPDGSMSVVVDGEFTADAKFRPDLERAGFSGAGAADTMSISNQVTGVVKFYGPSGEISTDGPSYTWAGKPSAAAGAGLVARITDVGPAPGILVMSDGTRWRPLNGRAVLARGNGSVAAPLATVSATGIIAIPDAGNVAGGALVLPAGLLSVGDALVARVKLRHRGTGGTWAAQVKIGTTKTSADGSVVALTGAATNDQYVLFDAEAIVETPTSFFSDGYATPNQLSTGAFTDKLSNFNTAAAMYCFTYVSSVNAADNVDLISYEFDWVA